MQTLPLLSRIFIMATERLPGYDVLVGCFEEDVHRTNLADDNWLYFIGLDASGRRRALPSSRTGTTATAANSYAASPWRTPAAALASRSSPHSSTGFSRTRTTRAVICMSEVATTAPAMSTARLASKMSAPRRAFPARASWC